MIKYDTAKLSVSGRERCRLEFSLRTMVVVDQGDVLLQCAVTQRVARIKASCFGAGRKLKPWAARALINEGFSYVQIA